MELRVRQLDSWTEVPELEPKWERLVGRNSTDCVFLSYAWLTTWWRHFSAGRQLLLLLVERAGDLVGAAPLMMDRQPFLEGGGRRVCFTADWQAMRMDLLAVPEERAQVVSALADHLLRQAPRWDVVDLDLVPAESPNLAALEADLRARGLVCTRRPRHESPYLPLGGSWGELQGALSRHMRRAVASKRRTLSNRASAQFVAFGPESEDAAMEKCFAISRESWQAQLGPSSSMASSPAMERFYLDIWRQAGERGWRAGSMVEIGGRAAAFQYCLDYHGRRHMLKTAYDPRYREHSPGFVVAGLAVQDACETGRHEVDFLGESEHWKQRWTDLTRPHTRLIVFGRSVRAHASRLLLLTVCPRLKRLVRPFGVSRTTAHGIRGEGGDGRDDQ